MPRDLQYISYLNKLKAYLMQVLKAIRVAEFYIKENILERIVFLALIGPLCRRLVGSLKNVNIEPVCLRIRIRARRYVHKHRL